MNKPKYQRSDECNLLTKQQAMEVFNIGETTLEKLAMQSGAKVKIGRLARYKKDVLQAHIDTFTVTA